MDFSAIVSSVLAVAERVAPMIVPGAKPAIEMGKAVANLVRNTMEIAGEDDQPALRARLDELQARVNAHADRTIASLGG